MRFDFDNDIMLEMRDAFFPVLYDVSQTDYYNEVYKYIRCYDDKNDEYYNSRRRFALVSTYDKKLQSEVRIQARPGIFQRVAYNNMLNDFKNWEYSKYMKFDFNNRTWK